MKRRAFTSSVRRGGGFTLIELVLVMLVIALAAAMIAPTMSSWSRGQRLRGTVDEFLSMTNYARAQAISRCEVYRVAFDPRGGEGGGARLQVQRLDKAGTYMADGDEFKEPVDVTDGFVAELLDSANKAIGSVDFYPNGRGQPARFVITDPQTGERLVAECQSATETFKMVTGGGQ